MITGRDAAGGGDRGDAADCELVLSDDGNGLSAWSVGTDAPAIGPNPTVGDDTAEVSSGFGP